MSAFRSKLDQTLACCLATAGCQLPLRCERRCSRWKDPTVWAVDELDRKWRALEALTNAFRPTVVSVVTIMGCQSGCRERKSRRWKRLRPIFFLQWRVWGWAAFLSLLMSTGEGRGGQVIISTTWKWKRTDTLCFCKELKMKTSQTLPKTH